MTNCQYEPQTAWPGIVRFVASFAGLCAIFSAVVTGVDGWQHQSHTRWPQIVAVVKNCSVEHPRATDRLVVFYGYLPVRRPLTGSSGFPAEHDDHHQARIWGEYPSPHSKFQSCAA